jgi:hypothetical protein
VQVSEDEVVWRRHRRRFTALLALVLVALLALLGVRELGARWQEAGRQRSPAVAAVTVTVQATDRVWVLATVDGRVAHEGTLLRGDRRTFTGRQAVDLHLGNAGGVQLTVDGRQRGAPGRPGQVWRGRFTPGSPDR